MSFGICEKSNCCGAIELKPKTGQHQFCPDCGAHLVFMCPKGHEIIKADQKFYVECGEPLKPKAKKGTSKARPEFAEM